MGEASQPRAAILRILGHIESFYPEVQRLKRLISGESCTGFLSKHRDLNLLLGDLIGRDSQLHALGDSVTGFVNLAAGAGLVADLLDGELPGHETVVGELVRLQDFALSCLLDGCAEQVRSLFRFSHRLVNVLRELSPARVVVLNLPVGNTIPCRVVAARAGESGLETVEVTRSLTRNPASSKGPTRRQQLAAAVEEASPGPDDVVLYVDEWVTGSNFRALTKDLKKICLRRKTRFLAAALVAPSAPDHPKWDNFCHRHNEVLATVGVNEPVCLRVTVPALPPPWTKERPFFWSEHDRLAGYRKFPIWGAVFSTIDATLRELVDNRAEVVRLCHSLGLGQRAALEDLDVPSVENAAWDMFRSGYHDFLRLRREIKNMTDPTGGEGAAADAGEINSVITAVEHEFRLQRRPALMCLNVAVARMQERGALRAVDPFYFARHTPSLLPTDGHVRRMHDELVRRIVRMSGEPGSRSDRDNAVDG